MLYRGIVEFLVAFLQSNCHILIGFRNATCASCGKSKICAITSRVSSISNPRGCDCLVKPITLLCGQVTRHKNSRAEELQRERRPYGPFSMPLPPFPYGRDHTRALGAISRARAVCPIVTLPRISPRVVRSSAPDHSPAP